MRQPFADEIRPETLEEVVGQAHLLAPGAVLRRLIEHGTETNMVFYGPSGTGKTTVANIIAKRTQKALRRLNATTASLQDVKEILSEVGTLTAPGGVLLYLDEIQYFNKKQQQSLLEFMENGQITLIASTTENPYFYVYGALLSRSAVFEFKSVPPEETEKAVLRALELEKSRSTLPLDWEKGLPGYLAQSGGGDVRKAVSAVALLTEAALPVDGRLYLTRADAEQLTVKSGMRYDRGGDASYDDASALMKSLRGSDPDAALHYLARFLEAGDLITPCRRLLCSASEDIGLAYPQAAAIVNACVDTATRLGLPEARLPLAQAAILLATAPKSNSVVEAIDKAMKDVRAGRTGDVPRHLQNVHADSAGAENVPRYKYPHSYPRHWVEQQYLPDALKGVHYYEWGDNRTEQAAKTYWEGIHGGHNGTAST
ncbi:MAG: replication-associated recombination protein A [Oscillibacter sp.]|nr:replication-associated recombination protein A [Oscillibacter sp.]